MDFFLVLFSPGFFVLPHDERKLKNFPLNPELRLLSALPESIIRADIWYLMASAGYNREGTRATR